MLSTTKLGNGLLLVPVLAGIAALVCPAIAAAQAAAPSPISGTSLGSGSSFGSSSGFSSSAGTGLSGSSSGLGGLSGSQQNNMSFRGGNSSLANTTIYGSYAGGAAGGTSGTGAAGTRAASAFSVFYMNPFALGMPNQSNASNFFGNASTGTQGSNYPFPMGSGSPLGGNLSAGSTSPGTGTGVRKVVPYTAGPGFDYRPTGPSVTRSEVEQVLARSTSLNPDRAIRVVVQGPAVVLRGTVASDHDRRLAEALIRLSPGVREVRNELEVPAQPASGP